MELRWDNDQKEAFWRLALNGYPGFPMHRTQLERGQPAATCPCGAHMNEGDRRHLFWECTMAVALREAIDASLDFDGLVDRKNLWLNIPPLTVHTFVWDVVCLAAISALDVGRRMMYREGGGAILPPPTLNRVSATVVSDFWARLQMFASQHIPTSSWDSVPRIHPFLSRDEAGHITCSLPELDHD